MDRFNPSLHNVGGRMLFFQYMLQVLYEWLEIRKLVCSAVTFFLQISHYYSTLIICSNIAVRLVVSSLIDHWVHNWVGLREFSGFNMLIGVLVRFDASLRFSCLSCRNELMFLVPNWTGLTLPFIGVALPSLIGFYTFWC